MPLGMGKLLADCLKIQPHLRPSCSRIAHRMSELFKVQVFFLFCVLALNSSLQLFKMCGLREAESCRRVLHLTLYPRFFPASNARISCLSYGYSTRFVFSLCSRYCHQKAFVYIFFTNGLDRIDHKDNKLSFCIYLKRWSLILCLLYR